MMYYLLISIGSFLAGLFVTRWIFSIDKFLKYQRAQTNFMHILVKQLCPDQLKEINQTVNTLFGYDVEQENEELRKAVEKIKTEKNIDGHVSF